MPLVRSKRDLIDIILRVPKEAFEKGPRPPLVHPDVIKDREERAKKAKADQVASNSGPLDS